MFRSRFVALIAATLLVAAIGVATTFATTKAQSAYVTTDTECLAPIDLQVNQVPSLAAANVWLKAVSEANVNDDLVWSLWQGGVEVGSGGFEWDCAYGDKYDLADPGFWSNASQVGTFTVKVDWFYVGGTNYSGDSFSVSAP